MAPNTTGHNATDHLRIMGLADLALHFAIGMLEPGGVFVAKVFQGGSEKTMLDKLKRHFATGAPCEAAVEPKRVQRVVCGGDWVSSGGLNRFYCGFGSAAL